MNTTPPQFSIKDLIKMFCFTNIRNYWMLLLCFTCCHGQLIRVTDIKCHTVDETFVTVTKCFTKSLSRTLSETTINVTLLQEAKTATIKLQFRKKINGEYSPNFHSDISFDGCQFMDNRAVSPIARYVFSAIEAYSNFNHSCPYKDYVLVDRFHIDMKKFRWMPAPPGQYLINTQWFVNGLQRFEFGVYFNFTR